MKIQAIKITILLLVVYVPGIGLQAQENGYDCLIEPSMSVEVGSSIRGVVDEVLVRRGDRVAKGDVLVRLESGVQVAAVNLARARSESTAEVESRKESMKLAKQVLARLEELYKTSSVSRQMLDEAESQAFIAESNWRQAKENALLAKLELAQASEILSLRTIKSSITGMVVERMVSPGELVTEDQAILRLAQINPLYVEVIMPAADFGTVVPHSKAIVTPSGNVKRDYVGEVAIVDNIIDAASGTFGVRVELANPEKSLPAGLNCIVKFESLER